MPLSATEDHLKPPAGDIERSKDLHLRNVSAVPRRGMMLLSGGGHLAQSYPRRDINI